MVEIDECVAWAGNNCGAAHAHVPWASMLQLSLTQPCLYCGVEDSWRHSLLECHMARCVWALERGDVIGFLSQKQHLDARMASGGNGYAAA